MLLNYNNLNLYIYIFIWDIFFSESRSSGQTPSSFRVEKWINIATTTSYSIHIPEHYFNLKYIININNNRNSS